MKLVLEVASGFRAGRKVWLSCAQVVRIGSTELADFCFPGDPNMSGVHFLVEHRDSESLVRDLNSRTGTWVNDQPVRQSRIANGDRIRAGGTVFRVGIEGIPTGPRPKDSLSEGPPMVATFDRRVTSNYRLQLLDSGIGIYESLQAEEDPLPRILQCKFGYFLVNMTAFSRSTILPGTDRAVCVTGANYLFPFHDKESAAAITAATWGKDSTIFLKTSMGMDQAQQQIKSVAASFCNPSVLRVQLDQVPQIFAALLLHHLDCVVLERENGVGWAMYSQLTAEADWRELGFAIPPE